MKGLITTSIIIAVLIAVSSGASLIIYNDLNNKEAAAHERGFEDGLIQGYEDGFQDGSEAGYQEGSKTGYTRGSWGGDDSSNTTGFYFVYNPTYDEVREILAEIGMSSAREINAYAEARGMRAAYVRSQIARKASEGMVYIYQLVAFETVDRGFIIIEPWSHEEVRVEVGKRYSLLNSRPLKDYDDTITKITIVW